MWCDYAKATKEQQNTFRRANPKLGPDYSRYRIWIKPDGAASRRQGHWEWTAIFAKLVDDGIRRDLRQAMTGEGLRNKGDLADFKTGDFHFAPESK